MTLNYLIIISIQLIRFIYCQKVIVGYFTDWTAGQFPVSSIDFTKVTHINYAFAIFNENNNPTIGTESILTDLVTKAHQSNVKVLISIGGWTGSRWFSPMVADKSKRSQFITNTIALVNKFNLDGVDIDWEYPGRAGADGNIVSSSDTANYLLLLKELRAAIGTKLITAAVRATPFDGMSNLSEFSTLFDWINLMCYDLNGPWDSITGPVGGLDHQPGKGVQLSIKQSVRDWSAAGFPYNKLVVGVPFYGYAENVSTDMTNSDQYVQINYKMNMYTYNDLFSNRILKTPLEANEAEGWIRKFDHITLTPWVFNKNTKTFIAYDDIQSLKSKTDYIRCNNLKGVMLWAMNHDYQNQLLTALQNLNSYGSCNVPSPPVLYPTSISNPQSPEPSGSCIDGSFKCGESKGSIYYQCIYGKWVKFNCANAAVCVQGGNAIHCGNAFKGFINRKNK